ncbi:hypothetical protein LTR04_002472 [Oleoguttula sp. CCFEE 6159]|nr:hypothetical protein LTR04_002472 [Oleoguttula sp. CCFEE 6159]
MAGLSLQPDTPSEQQTSIPSTSTDVSPVRNRAVITTETPLQQNLSPNMQEVSQAQFDDAAAQAETHIEASEGQSTNGDDGYETDSASSCSTSVTSSVRDYAFENGRRYHKFRQGAYVLPNDDAEQDREDMKHAMVLAVCGNKLHYAPIGENPQNIIDLGTGTGIWAMEMGDTYPSAEITGVDLSPIQPQWVPPNVKFIVDDVESPWLYPPDYFDLVHARHTVMAFKNWDKVLSEAYDHIKPSGFFEFQELFYHASCDDQSMPRDYAFSQYLSYIREGLGVFGVDLHATLALPNRLKAAGFVDVQERIIKIPIGTWPRNRLLKKVGLYLQAVIMDGLQGIALGPMCRGLGWSPESVEVFLADVRKSLRDSSVHSYYNLHIIYGRKPQWRGAGY